MSADRRDQGMNVHRRQVDRGSYLGAFRMAELREQKRHNVELVFCNLDQPGFSLALLPAVSVPVAGGGGGG